jgi:hypothetical protein
MSLTSGSQLRGAVTTADIEEYHTLMGGNVIRRIHVTLHKCIKELEGTRFCDVVHLKIEIAQIRYWPSVFTVSPHKNPFHQ